MTILLLILLILILLLVLLKTAIISKICKSAKELVTPSAICKPEHKNLSFPLSLCQYILRGAKYSIAPLENHKVQFCLGSEYRCKIYLFTDIVRNNFALFEYLHSLYTCALHCPTNQCNDVLFYIGLQ